MIVSASRRTDIPACFGEWFMQCMREGSVSVHNPFNPSQKTSVTLNPDEVEAIVFWTKNVTPFLSKLTELDSLGFKGKYVFHITINPYGKELERTLPPLAQRLQGIRAVSDRIGRERVFWRYDPVFYTSGYMCVDLDFHLKSFSNLARDLEPFVARMFFSPLVTYRKVFSRIEKLRKKKGLHISPPSANELCLLGQTMKQWGDERGIEILACAPSQELRAQLSHCGIEAGSCIDTVYLSRVLPGVSFSPAQTRKDPGQRPECQCMVSKDIGSYGTCLNQCVYCYAV